jgi:ABC-type proline/glycine betaine transport system permease subunit
MTKMDKAKRFYLVLTIALLSGLTVAIYISTSGLGKPIDPLGYRYNFACIVMGAKS